MLCWMRLGCYPLPQITRSFVRRDDMYKTVEAGSLRHGQPPICSAECTATTHPSDCWGEQAVQVKLSDPTCHLHITTCALQRAGTLENRQSTPNGPAPQPESRPMEDKLYPVENKQTTRLHIAFTHHTTPSSNRKTTRGQQLPRICWRAVYARSGTSVPLPWHGAVLRLGTQQR